MRIGLSTSVIQRGQTGVGQYVLALCRAFLTEASHHQFVLFVLEEDLPLFDFARGSMEILPVPERYRPPLRNVLWHQKTLPGLVRAHRIDLLHIPSYRRLLWAKPCPLVATIHDLAPFRVPGKYDWKRMLYARLIVRRLAHRQDQIIAISRNTASDIQQFFGFPQERLAVVHNGIDHQRFQPGPVTESKLRLLRQHGISAPFFVYVARLEHPGKNHIRLIQAYNSFRAATHSAHQLVLAGSDWSGAEEIHRAIAASPYADDILCPGFVPDSDLPFFYRAAEALVFPSLFEGFGMPPLEAMACGCPVISSGRGSLAEVIGAAPDIIDPESVEDMAHALVRIASDPAWKERLRTAGLLQARIFNWEKTARSTLDAYARAANPGFQPAGKGSCPPGVLLPH